MTSSAQNEALALLDEGLALEEVGQLQQGFDRFRAATEIDPTCGRAWRHLGNLFRRAGELGAASECFERALAAGDDRPLNQFFLSAVGIGPSAPQAPSHFVRTLFNQYAARFTSHLTLDLKYRAPQMLRDLVMRSNPQHFKAALDLGCGTGLAVEAFASTLKRSVGVDLSEEMLRRAYDSGLYEQLVHSSIDDYLASTAETFDLILCCDVLIYIGDVSALFASVSRVLAPQGSFAFTVESCEAEAGFDLLPNLRYAHSERYVRQIAQLNQFNILGVVRGTIREEAGAAVPGIAFHLGQLGG